MMSPFFIMHLPKLPTIFVKGGEERKAYFTIQAREMMAAGWVEKGTDKPKVEPKKVEIVAEAPKEEKPKVTRTRSYNKKVEE